MYTEILFTIYQTNSTYYVDDLAHSLHYTSSFGVSSHSMKGAAFPG